MRTLKQKMDIWKKVGLVSTFLIVFTIPSLLFCIKQIQRFKKKQAGFVGGKECISCHQQEYDLWKGSDHAQNAMGLRQPFNCAWRF